MSAVRLEQGEEMFAEYFLSLLFGFIGTCVRSLHTVGCLPCVKKRIEEMLRPNSPTVSVPPVPAEILKESPRPGSPGSYPLP